MQEFLKGVRAEFGKIIWPSRELLMKETAAVVAVSVVLGAVIAILDWALQLGLGLILR